jgi:hypothetical protein
MAAIAKSIVLLSGAITTLYLLATICWQTVRCLGSDGCTTISVQEVFNVAGIHISRSYFTSSVDPGRPTPLQLPELLEPLLDLPVIVALLIATALLGLFYWSIHVVEGRLD